MREIPWGNIVCLHFSLKKWVECLTLLTYTLPAGTFEDDCPFLQVGYV